MAAGTAEHDPYAGRTLEGGFRTHQLIGRGMFARVYDGAGPDGQPVAIKILTRRDEQAERRFYREIKVCRELPPNPHVVGFRGQGQAPDGAPFMAMELVDGFTLRSVLKPGFRLDERPACGLMVQLCESFQGLHQLGLAHRDIKPDNIMLTNVGKRVKLMDFGLVKDAQGLLKLFEEQDILAGQDFADNLEEGMVAGTPEYMAPEQISDPSLSDPLMERTDTTADVYALGVIFYQMLSGRKPFPARIDGDDREATRQMLRYMEWRLEQDDDDLPVIDTITPELWSIVAKALRRNPKHRQGTAGALLADIERYLEHGEGVEEDDLTETLSIDVNEIAELAAMLGTGAQSPFGGLVAPRAAEPAHATPAPTQPPRPTGAAPAPAPAEDFDPFEAPVRLPVPGERPVVPAATRLAFRREAPERQLLPWILAGLGVLGAATAAALFALGYL